MKYLDKITFPELQELTQKAIERYGNEEKTAVAEKVIDVFLHMLDRKNQIQIEQEHPYPGWVSLMIAAGYMHNLFYDGTLVSIFKAREEITELAKELNVPVNGIAALFQAVEGQLGDRMPVESCKPIDSTPNGLFSWACWFVEEYNGNKPLPDCTAY